MSNSTSGNTIKKLLTFSTIESSNSNSSSPTFYLTNPLTNVLNYTITAFNGINNTYNINTSNNNFSFTEVGHPAIQFSIPIGNYTIDSLILELVSEMNTNSLGGNVYTVIYNTLTNVVQINAVTPTVAWSLTPIANNMYYVLGYTNSQLNTTPGYLFVANNQFDLSGLNTLLIGSNSLSDNSVIVNSQIPIIATIPVTGSYSSPITFQQTFNCDVTCNLNQIAIITFRLYDQRLNLITMPSDWSISILFECN